MRLTEHSKIPYLVLTHTDMLFISVWPISCHFQQTQIKMPQQALNMP